MVRRAGSLSLAVLALVALAAPVSAARPVGNCPADSSGYVLVDQQEWWDRTVAGFEAEGIDVYEDGVVGNPDDGFTQEFEDFSIALGFESADDLYDFVWVTQWVGMDKNNDLHVCMKDRPVTPGNPAYFFNGIDNTAK